LQETINKLKSYFGFSIKSNSILFGSDNIIKTRKNLDVVIFCSTATDKHIYPIQNKGVKCVKLKSILLSELVGRDNVKVVGIKNLGLSKAILSFKDMFETLE
jgi:hypothetical protein